MDVSGIPNHGKVGLLKTVGVVCGQRQGCRQVTNAATVFSCFTMEGGNAPETPQVPKPWQRSIKSVDHPSGFLRASVVFRWPRCANAALQNKTVCHECSMLFSVLNDIRAFWRGAQRGGHASRADVGVLWSIGHDDRVLIVYGVQAGSILEFSMQLSERSIIIKTLAGVVLVLQMRPSDTTSDV